MSTPTVLLSQIVAQKPITGMLMIARVATALAVFFGKGQNHHTAKHGLGLLVLGGNHGSEIIETKPGTGSRGMRGQLHWSIMMVYAMAKI